MAKYNQQIVKKICKDISNGVTVTVAAVCAGICKDTFYDWMKKKPDFSDAVEKAQSDCLKKVEDALCKKAFGGVDNIERVFERRLKKGSKNQYEMKLTKETKKKYAPSETALIFWLCNKSPDFWKNIQHKILSGALTLKAADIRKAKREHEKEKKEKKGKEIS